MIQLDHGHKYDPKRGILYSCSNGGLFSNFYHTSWSLVDLKNQGHAPREISFTSGFDLFRGLNTTDLYPFLFRGNEQARKIWEDADLPWLPRFDHHGVYDLYPKQIVDLLMKAYFQPSEQVEKLADHWMKIYDLQSRNFICIYFRGTDKVNEVRVPEYYEMLNRAIEISRISGVDCILLQTDDAEVQDAVRRRMPDVVTIDALPTARGTEGFHFVNQNSKLIDPTEFSVRLCAAVSVMARAHSILAPSSNLSGWLYQVRGDCGNFLQYNKHGKPVTMLYRRAFAIKNLLRIFRACVSGSQIYYV